MPLVSTILDLPELMYKQFQGIWIPAGRYSFSYRLNLQNNFVIRGAGPWYTELHGHDFGKKKHLLD